MTIAITLEAKHTLIRQATLASVIAAALIIGGKAVAWWLTGSVSLLASLADSILDIAASVINFLAVRYAMQPPDKEHRFGHGKAENLAAFAQASFITLSGLFVAIEAIKRFFITEPTSSSTIGIAVMVFSTLITLMLVFFQRYVIIHTKSTVIQADRLHYTSDIFMNILVIFSLISTQFFNILWIDPVFALAIAGYIIHGAWDIGVNAFHDLMDREFNDDERQRIKDIILQHNSVKGYHRLKTRSSGGKAFIQFDLELDGTISLREAHTISDAIEMLVIKEFPEAEVIIHQDPV